MRRWNEPLRLNAVRIMVLASLIGGSLFAQGAAAANPAGVWRGRSLCLVHPSACHDEVVVYRITRANTRDSLSIDARKIVNGQEEAMGMIGCRSASASSALICPMPNGTWHFTIHGDSLVGDLRLPNQTKFRDVRAARSR
jgi:hypothetical protein